VTRWLGLRLDEKGPVLCYEIAGTRIEEEWAVLELSKSQPMAFRRTIKIAPHRKPLSFALSSTQSFTADPSPTATLWTLDTHLEDKPVLPPPHSAPVAPKDLPTRAPPRVWKEEVRVPAPAAAPNEGALVFEDVALPLPNPWKRNVRPSDFDFFPDGRLALCTFDGDVWIADGIEQDRPEITWHRFASGLHESMGLRIQEGIIVVFDRNGLTRLIDRDGNGEADYYESLSALAAQTAETREFPMSFELKPGGGYYLAKGGQVGSTRGKYNGNLIEISPDGQKLKVIATGLRQPFIGVDPQTGLLTASDQQGHWVPATPLHLIRPGHYYGFQPTRLGANANQGRQIVEPPLWIPHFVNQSGARQVWLRKAKMGALNDCLIHLAYNRPALFKLYLDQKNRQGAIVPLLDGFPTGLLGGRVNPKDGLLYVGGLNIWGTVGKKVQGLYRVRPTGNPHTIPREIRAYQEGIVFKFDHELEDAQASKLANYTVDRWNYKRSNQYGSGHYKLDGTPGQESLAISCVFITEDHQSVFLGIPGMKPVDSLRVTFQVEPENVQTAFLTIRHLPPVDLTYLGFEETEVDLTPQAVTPGAKRPKPSAELGSKVATTYGCIACHSADGAKKVAEDPSLMVGPSWKGLYGSKRKFTDGTSVKKADEVYLRESILDPSRNVTKGFETTKTGVGMPSYLGVLRDDQIESLILYIKSLK
jgi:cytochrome c553